MAIVVIGLHHRVTPLDVLERLTVRAEDLPKVLTSAVRRDWVSEAVVLSTCNRIEIYAVVERFHDACAGLRSVLAEHADVPVAAIADHLAVEFDDAAVDHLFNVAAGLDSAVLGETEILGQIKTAWGLARDEGAVGPQLNALFRHALHVGKRARTETGISRSEASVSSAAVALAADRLDGLAGRRALVLGAGDMGRQMAVALTGAGVAGVAVANRSDEAARDLAAMVQGEAVSPGAVSGLLGEVDLVLTSTAADHQILDFATVEAAVARRGGRPLMIVDIAVPRDVEPGVGELPGVELCDMDDLRARSEAGRARRRGEIAAVEAIVQTEWVRFRAQRSARAVAPVIAELRAHGEAIRQAELGRFAGRLDALSDPQRAQVEALTHRIVAKLLHQPSVRLAELAGSARGDRLVDSLADLFDLDEPEGDPVTDEA